MVKELNDYLAILYDHLDSIFLAISPGKSSVTLFTSNPRESDLHPQVVVNNQLLPLVKSPKILGVTFDTHFTFNHHAEVTAAKVHKRNNVIKALAGTDWGQDKETLIVTYKAIGRSIIDYAAPVWSPNLSASNWQRLQIPQNTALRTATGCHKMSSIAHLHQETKIMPVKEHANMLSAQYLAGCRDTSHPCHTLLTPHAHPRDMKHTLDTKHRTYVATRTQSTNGTPDIPKTKRFIHTSFVAETVSGLAPNKVLNALPPEIHSDEQLLPRSVRTRLAQLRSSYSKSLMHYQNRIYPQIPDVCPLCNMGPHDVHHLFNCPATPTDATVEDLWLDPQKVAAALAL